MGFKKIKKNKLIEKTVNPIGINISKIENPIFLREVNSLLFIKFLIKKVIAIIHTKGSISFKIDGSLNKDKIK